MVAAHPPQASPHRGYSFIGQEKISGITGFADGKPDKTALQDIKVRDTLQLNNSLTNITDIRSLSTWALPKTVTSPTYGPRTSISHTFGG
jgi:hypothetical protein